MQSYQLPWVSYLPVGSLVWTHEGNQLPWPKVSRRALSHSFSGMGWVQSSSSFQKTFWFLVAKCSCPSAFLPYVLQVMRLYSVLMLDSSLVRSCWAAVLAGC